MKGLFKTRLLFAVVAFLLCFGITSVSYGQAVISVDPAESPSPGVGRQLTIRLKITNGRNIAGYEVSVHFDTSALRYVSSANGSYLPAGAFFAPPQVSGGKVTLTAVSVPNAAQESSGTLASVTFSVVAVQASTLRLTGAALSDSNAGSVSVSTRNGSVVESRVPKWDVNQDGIVNVFDLALVAKSLGSSDVRADVTGDGTVNVFDLALVAKHLGESTTGGTTRPPVTKPPVLPPPVLPPPSDLEPVANGVSVNGVTKPPVPPPPSDPFEGMVLIPAGEFRMGSNSGESHEKPIHSVYVGAFYMDKYEVTNAQYAAFLNAKGKHTEGGKTWLNIGGARARIEYVAGVYRAKGGYENHPVTHVSWYGAVAYSKWKGKRLPTEAEWEKAARGNLSGLKYPWGNTIDSSKANYGSHIGDTTAVGKYTANGYGLYDMAGNVWEWCLDEYNSGFYALSPSQNPLSGANSIRWILDNYAGVKSSRVMRGGSSFYPARKVRVAARSASSPTFAFNSGFGFRCVRAVTH